jgi:hypothetical protein
MFSDISSKEIGRLFPRLMPEEAEGVRRFLRRSDVVEALAEMKAACSCVAGSLFCTCEEHSKPSKKNVDSVAALAVAFAKGVEPVSLENERG